MTNEDDKKGAEPEFYFPPNRLARAIVDRNGPSLQEMEAEAEARLAESKDEYDDILNATILHMKTVLANEEDSVERHRILYENAHDIKGQAALFGYPLVGNVAICICVAIMEVPEKLAAHEDLLQLHLDALQWAFIHQNDEKLDAEKAALVHSLRDALHQK